MKTPILQRCLSGLRSTIGNRVTGKTGPEVRILFSAPKQKHPKQGCFSVGVEEIENARFIGGSREKSGNCDVPFLPLARQATKLWRSQNSLLVSQRQNCNHPIIIFSIPF